MFPIVEVARSLGIRSEHFLPYGHDKGKIALAARDSGRPAGRLILVSAITPTDAGEGKTTTSIGLAQGLAKIGQKVCLALREPSLGPVFGRKGGATGGGKAIVVPQDDINLHFLGDFHAISTAHNLLAALIDNHLHFGNVLRLDTTRIHWRRVVDLNDRSLRNIVVGLGGTAQGVPRETGFDITPASEVMAALCLAEDPEDLRARLGRMIVGLTHAGEPVTADQLQATGSMMALLRDALLPNLVQTIDGVPALIHGGPFANIAHGCNSVIATKMALAHADWTVTEAGFGFDLGAEKFFDIKCVQAKLQPAAVVLVATVRALKMHGGAGKADLSQADVAKVELGLQNLDKHLESIRAYGILPIVALNRFGTDHDDEVAAVRKECERLDVPFAVSDVYAHGAEGGTALAEIVVHHARNAKSQFKPLYDAQSSAEDKMNTVARIVYGAHGVVWTAAARRDLETIKRFGYGHLPLCVAKTQKSLSDDPALYGRPTDFDLTIRNVILAAGAGYIVPLLGDILRMPGLPKEPQAHRIDLVSGQIVGVAN